MRILYTGPLTAGGTCEMRRRTLERLGHETTGVDYLAFAPARVWRRPQWRLRAGPFVTAYNRAITTALQQHDYDMLWIDKGLFVWASTVRAARQRGLLIVHYSPDNYLLRQNTSRHLRQSLPLYDLIVTTKRHNAEPLRRAGARQVLLSGNAYDPDTHRPLPLNGLEDDRLKCDVSFIGRWEPEREALLARIARLDIRLSIRGFGWHRTVDPAVRRVSGGGAALGDDYAKAVCGAAINLGLLSTVAGDDITQRSIEIPACGGFMLAARTAAHEEAFADGREAAFYSTERELMDKIRYYLAHDEERRAVARAGLARCRDSGYSYDDRLAEILARLADQRAAVTMTA